MLALTDPRAPERVMVITRQAGVMGVMAGMSVTAARAACAVLELRPWDANAIAQAVHEVSAALLGSSPQVSVERPGIWWIGASGFGGKPDGRERAERRIAAQLLAVGQRWHPDARAGIASSCVAAQAATWLPGNARIVPPGRDGELLASAPLAFIPMDGEVRETLAALGLTKAGQLASLDAGDVEQRLGPAGLAAWRLARGEDGRRPSLSRPVPADTVELELPVPAETLEPVLFLVRAALGRLLDAVRSDGQAVAGLEMEIRTERRMDGWTDGASEAWSRSIHPSNDPCIRLSVSPSRPLARLEPLYEQCRAALENVSLDAPALGIMVRITQRAAVTGEQGDLLHTGWRDPAAAEAAFARLRATLGGDAVVRPMARDAFVPEREGCWVPAGHGDGAALPAATTHGASWRLLPLPEVITANASTFTWRERQRAITARRGLERLSGEWWKDAYARDYDCWESDGVRFLVFRSGAQWYLQGWWD